MEKIVIFWIAFIVFFSISCGQTTLCGNSIKSEAQSPDGKYLATLFQRDCGATTDFSTIVNIRPFDSKFNPDNGIVLLIGGQPNVSLRWIANSSLQIVCKNCLSNTVFKEENQWREIQISRKQE